MAPRSALTLVTMVLMTACGGGGDADGAGGGAPPPPAAGSPSEEAAPTPGPECEETDELVALDNEWQPECVVTSGTLTVTNEGEAQHTFTVTGSVDILLAPGSSEVVDDVTEAAEPVGETYFQCRIHPGMDGFFWVA